MHVKFLLLGKFEFGIIVGIIVAWLYLSDIIEKEGSTTNSSFCCLVPIAAMLANGHPYWHGHAQQELLQEYHRRHGVVTNLCHVRYRSRLIRPISTHDFLTSIRKFRLRHLLECLSQLDVLMRAERADHSNNLAR